MPQLITERLGENPVLCAVDASEHGWEVARGAALLALRVGAPLELLHVARRAGWRGAVDRLSTDEAACADYQESWELLERYAAVSPVATSYSVLKGDAAEAILLAVGETRPPVLVLGSRGRSTLRDLIGRTSHSVMSHTSVATLVVSPDADASALDRSGPVVCGVDETAASLHAADEAAALASAAATDLVLVAVCSPQASSSPAPSSGEASVGESPLTIERERRLLRDIAEGIAESTAERARTRVIIDAGDPATRLNAIAAELDSCLLVIGGSTGSSIEDALRGSVARSLSGSASRAVLVVPSVRHA